MAETLELGKSLEIKTDLRKKDWDRGNEVE